MVRLSLWLNMSSLEVFFWMWVVLSYSVMLTSGVWEDCGVIVVDEAVVLSPL